MVFSYNFIYSLDGPQCASRWQSSVFAIDFLEAAAGTAASDGHASRLGAEEAGCTLPHLGRVSHMWDAHTSASLLHLEVSAPPERLVYVQREAWAGMLVAELFASERTGDPLSVQGSREWLLHSARGQGLQGCAVATFTLNTRLPRVGLATGTLSEGVSGKAVVESTVSHPHGQYLQKLEKNKSAADMRASYMWS